MIFILIDLFFFHKHKSSVLKKRTKIKRGREKESQINRKLNIYCFAFILILMANWNHVPTTKRESINRLKKFISMRISKRNNCFEN